MIAAGPRRFGDESLGLREITPEDSERLFCWRTEARQSALFHTTGPASRDAHRAFLADYFSAGNRDGWFIIEEKRRAVGAVAYYRSGREPERWEAGRLVFDPAVRGPRGLRLAGGAIELLKQFARGLGHTAICCEVLAENRTMLAIVAAVGFEERRQGVRGGRRYLLLCAPLHAGGATGPRASISTPHGEVRLRPVERRDVRFLFALRMHRETRPMFRSGEPVSFAQHRSYLASYFAGSHHGRWFVIEREGAPVGAIALYGRSADGRRSEWGRFAVLPDLRGQGIGRAALTLLLEHARALGVERLSCEVLESNAGALALYRSLGFVTIGAEVVGGRRFERMELVVAGG